MQGQSQTFNSCRATLPELAKNQKFTILITLSPSLGSEIPKEWGFLGWAMSSAACTALLWKTCVIANTQYSLALESTRGLSANCSNFPVPGFTQLPVYISENSVSLLAVLPLCSES